MKRKMNLKLRGAILLVTFSLFGFVSCDKYDDREVIENTFTGNVDVTSGAQDPAGDFTGTNASGTFSFAWINPQSKASANFDLTSSSGSVQMIIEDDKGKVVLNQTRSAGGVDTYAGVSDEGTSGLWIVKIIITDLNGDGSYSLHPGS